MNDCKVPCDPVDRKLDMIWNEIRKRVPWMVFTLVLSGLAMVLLFFGREILSNQGDLSKQITGITVNVSTNTQAIAIIREDVQEIKRSLRRKNEVP